MTPRPSAWAGRRPDGPEPREVRTVLDTSVLVAALVTPNPASASRIVLAAAAAGAVRLVVSDELEEEYRRAVEYPQVVRHSAMVNRQAFVTAVVELRRRAGSG